MFRCGFWKMLLAVLAGIGGLSASRSLEAHFVWLAIQPAAEGPATAHVWFSELSEPGDAKLLGRIADVAVWRGEAPGQGEPLTLTEEVRGQLGSWSTQLSESTSSLVGSIDYGVISREGETFMLKYYARYGQVADGGTTGGESALPLDVQAELVDGQIRLTVLAAGQPLADAEVTIVTPSYEEIESHSDENGQFTLNSTQSGRYSIRARQISSEAGEFEGQHYDSVRGYATLTLDVSAPAASGSEILSSARRSRAVWHDFPGFTAQVEMHSEAGTQYGTLRVQADGKLELEGIDDARVLTTLRSLIMHRMPGDTDAPDVSLVEEETEHPLGQLVNLDYDVAMGSSYRVRDSVVRQVNREIGSSHFSISVLDFTRNPQGAYLPTVFAIDTWAEDGSLESSTTVQERWLRVGQFDLPAQHFMVTAGDDKLEYIDLVFSDHQLAEASE